MKRSVRGRPRLRHVAIYAEQWDHRGLSHQDGSAAAAGVWIPEFSELPFEGTSDVLLRKTEGEWKTKVENVWGFVRPDGRTKLWKSMVRGCAAMEKHVQRLRRWMVMDQEEVISG